MTKIPQVCFVWRGGDDIRACNLKTCLGISMLTMGVLVSCMTNDRCTGVSGIFASSFQPTADQDVP